MITLPLKTNKNKVAVPHILRSVTGGRMEKQESGIRNLESGTGAGNGNGTGTGTGTGT